MVQAICYSQAQKRKRLGCSFHQMGYWITQKKKVGHWLQNKDRFQVADTGKDQKQVDRWSNHRGWEIDEQNICSRKWIWKGEKKEKPCSHPYMVDITISESRTNKIYHNNYYNGWNDWVASEQWRLMIQTKFQTTMSIFFMGVDTETACSYKSKLRWEKQLPMFPSLTKQCMNWPTS